MDDPYARYREALRLGHQQAAEGRFADALRHYQAAVEVAGERALPHIAVGSMLLRLGRPRDALAAYERAVERAPADLDALTGQAAALLASGRRAEAAHVRERIDALREKRAGTPVAPAGAQTPLTGSEALAAAGEQARAAGNVPAAISAWLAESAEHTGAGHFDAALDACLRAVALDSGSVRVHLELARIYFLRGWHERGVERVVLLQHLLTLAPDAQIEDALAQLIRDRVTADERAAEVADGANSQG